MTKKVINQNTKLNQELINTIEPKFIFADKPINRFNILKTDNSAQQFNKESQKQKINAKVLDLIYRYNVYPESYLEELLEIAVNNPESINQTLKSVSGK